MFGVEDFHQMREPNAKAPRDTLSRRATYRMSALTFGAVIKLYRCQNPDLRTKNRVKTEHTCLCFCSQQIVIPAIVFDFKSNH